MRLLHAFKANAICGVVCELFFFLLKRLWPVVPCVFVSVCSLAQSDPASILKTTIIPPSPEAVSLGRYGALPVSLNNGLPQISIPLYEIKTSRRAIPLSLSYHAAGVRAYDISSCVGQGWSFIGGFSISRVVKGLPDESNTGILNSPFPDIDASGVGIGEHVPCFIGRLAGDYGMSPVDGQHDEFSFNLGGFSGKFVFKDIKDVSAPREIYTIPYSPLKISVSIDFKFTIVDVDGTTYTFDQVETTNTSSGSTQQTNVPTTWYVTSIVSADKTDTITFNYTPSIVVTSRQGSRSMTVTESVIPVIDYPGNQTIITHMSVHLSEILYSTGKVCFHYETDRIDQTGARRLTTIKVFQKRGESYTQFKQFNFAQSYFQAESGQISQVNNALGIDEMNKRLRLDSVYEQGFILNVPPITKPAYVFEYENPDGLPAYGSTAQDFMGYYNGAKTNQNLLFYGVVDRGEGVIDITTSAGANRNTDPERIKAGSLKKITYPTGGSTTFNMVANHFDYSRQVIEPVYASGGPEVISTRAGVYELEFPVILPANADPNTLKGTFTMDLHNTQTKPISTTVTVFDVTDNVPAKFKAPLVGPDTEASVGVPAPGNGEVVNDHWDYQLVLKPNHTYRLAMGTAWDLTTQNLIIASINWQANAGTVTRTVTGTEYTGGLRVESMIDDDGYGHITQRNFEYKDWYYNSNLFNGDMDAMAKMLRGRTLRWQDLGGSHFGSVWVSVYAENLTFQAGSISGTVASYATVEETRVDASGKPAGKTVHRFYQAIDDIPSLAPIFRSDLEWKRTQEEKQEIYKSNDNGGYNLVKEVINDYDNTVLYTVKNYWASLKEDIAPSGLVLLLRECMVPSLAVYNFLGIDQDINKSDLIQRTTIDYDETGHNPKTTIEQFAYGNFKHSQLTGSTKTTSDGRIETNNFSYPLDYIVTTCDPDLCKTYFENQINQLIATRNACELEALSRSDEFSAQAGQIYFALVDTRDERIEQLCKHTDGTYSPSCIDDRWGEFNDAVEASQYGELQAMSLAIFNNDYMACQPAFRNSANQLIPQFNTCQADYITCVNDYLSGVAPDKDKAIVLMQRDNFVNTTIENTSGIITSGVEYITGAVRKDFKPVSGTPLMDVIWGFNSAPVTKTAFDQSPASYYRKVGTLDQYDSKKNLIQRSKTNDVVTSYLWDYKQEYPVAEATNAAASDLAYTSFEPDCAGGWSFAAAGVGTTGARTGDQSYDLSDGAVSHAISVTGRVYVVAFWAQTGASVALNGTALAKVDLPAVNGWELYQASVTRSTSVTSISISGTGLIDELRCYPAGAVMTTYTYDTTAGVTSKTDANNQVTYYSYDALRRLSVIRDNQFNLLKTVNYHYKKQRD